ncbi:hypothetical protein ACWC0C_35300 [Streptomyces sp. NPDC001709]
MAQVVVVTGAASGIGAAVARHLKIVVVGGTGLIGSQVVALLRDSGHEALSPAPATGVDAVTGEGLAEALKGADVVVDVSNSPSSPR